jgi:hypothetical protein
MPGRGTIEANCGTVSRHTIEANCATVKQLAQLFGSG